MFVISFQRCHGSHIHPCNLRKKQSFEKYTHTHTHTHQGSPTYTSDESQRSDVMACIWKRICEGERQKQKSRQQEKKKKRWELYKRQLIIQKKGKIMQVTRRVAARNRQRASERERERDREKETNQKISACCSHHHAKDRAPMCTYTRRYSLIFDTGNVSS